MDNLIQRSDNLDARLERIKDLDKTISELVQAGKRTNKFIRWIVISVVLNMIFTICFSYTFVTIHNNAMRVVLCESVNTSSAINLNLWRYLLDIPPAIPRTPEQEVQRKKLIDYLDGAFATKVCL